MKTVKVKLFSPMRIAPFGGVGTVALDDLDPALDGSVIQLTQEMCRQGLLLACTTFYDVMRHPVCITITNVSNKVAVIYPDAVVAEVFEPVILEEQAATVVTAETKKKAKK